MRQHGLGSLVFNAILGLLLGAICLAAGLMVVGMGHGWELPFKYGWLSLLFYPLAMMRWRWIGDGVPWWRDVGATAAIGLPILAVLIVVAGPGYFMRSALAGWPVLVFGIPLYWFAGHVLERSGRAALSGDAVLLAIGVAMSIAAIAEFGGSGIARRSGALLVPWVALWLGWQAMAVLALLRHARAKPELS